MLAVYIRPGSDAGSRMQYGVHRFRRIVRVGGFHPVRVCDSGDDGESFIWTVGLSFPLFEGQFDELCAYSFPNAEAEVIWYFGIDSGTGMMSTLSL